MEEEYGLESFPRDEIAYIVMHIGAALEKSIPRDTDEIRVVIMCASGIGTAKMLSERLQREFARLRVIGEISLMDLNRLDELKADILITTLDLVIDCRLPVVKVSPLLNRDDIGKIENILQIKGGKGQQIYEEIEDHICHSYVCDRHRHRSLPDRQQYTLRAQCHTGSGIL